MYFPEKSLVLPPSTVEVTLKKASHRRARNVLPNPLDDDTIHVIQGIWKDTSSPSVRGFSSIKVCRIKIVDVNFGCVIMMTSA